MRKRCQAVLSSITNGDFSRPKPSSIRRPYGHSSAVSNSRLAYLDARLNLAAVQLKSGDYGDALKNLEILLVESPDHPQARLYAGFCAMELDDMTAAVDHWRRFVELAPDHVDAAKIRQALESQPNR